MDKERYLNEMKSLFFGVELEFTGISRSEARKVLKGFFKDEDMMDETGREWNIKYDSSIVAKVMINGTLIHAPEEYKVELVSPILEYKDIPMLQELVRTLRHAGAIDTEKSGLHVHVSEEGHTADTLRNLIKLMSSKESLLIKALEIPDERLYQYCNCVDSNLVKAVNKRKFKNMDELIDIWYTTSDRYRMLNYSSLFDKKGIEFRCYNSCVKSCGKLRSYIVLSLALVQSAKVLTRASSLKPKEDNERYIFRCFLNRLGLVGKEFKVVRKYLLQRLSGDSSFAIPENHNRHRVERNN